MRIKRRLDVNKLHEAIDYLRGLEAEMMGSVTMFSPLGVAAADRFMGFGYRISTFRAELEEELERRNEVE